MDQHQEEPSFWDLPIPSAISNHDRMRDLIENLTDARTPMFQTERDEIAECLEYLMMSVDHHNSLYEETFVQAVSLGEEIQKTIGKRQAKKILPEWLRLAIIEINKEKKVD